MSAIFDRLNVKTERADKHIHDLAERIRSFGDSRPCTISHKDDTNLGERIYYVDYIRPIPLEFSAIIGDALQNLRSALDHLATHLVNIGSDPMTQKPYYPIFESSHEYEAGKMRKIQGMSPEAIKAIDATEPYARGNGWVLRDLQILNNRDKHCLLIPALVGLFAHAFPRTEKEKIEKILNETFPQGLSQGWLKAAVGPVFLEDGRPVLSLPISELQDHMKFRFDLAFREPEIVKGKPAVATLQSMSKLVRKIISDFYDGGLL